MALGTSTVTLMELTAAYAGVAANAFPVEPTAFADRPQGWADWLWGSKSTLSPGDHEAIEGMLRAAINRGTGRAAMLRGANFGKTGTTQDYRDALFVGYAGGLVVGVWVGNDDNSPLDRVTGGGLPARIWRDFMASALGETSRPAPRSAPSPDPAGPVQPQDVEANDFERAFDLGEGTRLQINEGEAVISLDVEGLPVDLRLDDEEGFSVRPGRPVDSPEPPPE